ncbi:MAG: SMC-Scp complex subunit ScpB [Clostridia bacterium]|nr:SMC-Scp complex subunit ScpB [Clostridia bacterium]MDD7482620.1 SMC-Scp complex subunit ScpB [Clostridia bacterium]
MKIREMQSKMEAILFAAGEPMEIGKLGQVLELDLETVEKILRLLADRYGEEESGLCLLRLDDSVQISIRPQWSSLVRSALDMRRNVPLSQAAMEVLAVIAYNQPVTRAYIEQVRGVDCSGAISGLINKGLVEERGRLELPGRPLLYGTTLDFLRCMGLSSLEELPPLPEMKEEDSDTRD